MSLKRQEARARHKRNKRRAKYRALMREHGLYPYEQHMHRVWTDMPLFFSELGTLNAKILLQLFNDIRAGHFTSWDSEFTSLMKNNTEAFLMEKTILK